MRLLLGVSGGIAAYKAVELVRLATAAGHSVRVVQTPASLRFVGRATFEGVTGAPVLVDEFEPDPARGRLSRASRCPTTTRSRTWSWCAACDAFAIAPGVGQHDRQAGRRPRRQPAHQRGAGLHRAAGDGAGDEQRHVGAPGHARERRDAAPAGRDHRGARHRAGWPRGASGGRAGWPSRRRSSARSRARRWTASRFAPRSLDGLRVLVTAGGTREPIDSVRYVGNRSSGRMGAGPGRGGRRRAAPRSPCRRERALLERPPGCARVEVETAAELRGGRAGRVRRRPTCC